MEMRCVVFLILLCIFGITEAQDTGDASTVEPETVSYFAVTSESSEPSSDDYDTFNATDVPTDELSEKIYVSKDIYNVTDIIVPGTENISKELEIISEQSSKNCDRRLIEKEFILEHPGYPANYGSGQLCRYVIGRASRETCGVEITFNKFDLEMSPGCKSDYFAIGDERLCGQINQDTVVEYPFDNKQDELLLAFKSNNEIVKSGFKISMKQIATCDNDLNVIDAVHACDVLITDVSGELVTHRSPESKEPACRYSIGRRHSGYCQVELDFVDFNVEYTPGCISSFVQLDGHRFCGTALRSQRKNVTFDASGNVQIIYRTDTLRSDLGFHLLFQQIPCPPPGQPVRSPGGTDLIGDRVPNNCNRVFYEKEFYLESPGFPNAYSNNLDCHLVVRKYRESVCQIDIRFLDFDVESSPGCVYDYLQLESERLCGRIPEDQVRTLNFWGYEKVLRFKSDSLNPRPGFFLYVRQLDCSGGVPVPTQPLGCDSHLWSTDGRFSSPNYPANYPNNINCRYTVHRLGEHICQLRVTFLDFRLQAGSGGCYRDYLEIDGWRACGDRSTGTTRVFDFRSPEKVLTFSSDPWATEPGFLLSIRQIPCGQTETRNPCDKEIEAPNFELRSEYYPLNYPPGLDCRYTIRRSSSTICQLKVRLSIFDMEPSVACSHDYLILDGERLCGFLPSNTTRILRFDNLEKIIMFHSDSAVERPGFLANIEQIDCASGRSQQPPSSDRLPQPPSSGRYPELPGSGRPSQSPSSGRPPQSPSSGRPIQPPTSDRQPPSSGIPGSNTNTMSPSFQPNPSPTPQNPSSSSSSSSSGSSACTNHFAELRSTFNSPGYPSLYPNDLNCRYIIHLTPGYCKVEFTFVEFYLEQPLSGSFHCLADYLEIGSARYCGQQINGLTKTEPSYGSAREVVLTFFTNNRISDKGFLISYRQLLCSGDNQLPSPAYPPASESQPSGASRPEGDPLCSDIQSSSVFDIRGPALGTMEYGQSLQCLHQVRRLGPDTCNLKVTFITFELGDGSDCPRQHLQIGDNVLCGNLPAYTMREYPFQGYWMSIKLTTTRLPRPIMHIRVEQTPCTPTPNPPRLPPACDETFTTTTFELRSPFYPHGFESRVDCRYIVRKTFPSICRLELTLERFSLPTSQHCRLGSFRVDADTLCGTIVPFSVRVYDFSAIEKLIHFQSENIVAGTGFLVKGRQVPCGNAALEVFPAIDSRGGHIPGTNPNPPSPSSIRCDQSFGLREFTIFSPNHPEWYPPSVLCRYIILRTDSDICGLDVTFLNFDLEDYYHCQRDYLDIDGERLCGILPIQSTRHYAFHPADRTKVLVFRSDHTISRPGFALRIRQTTECQAKKESLLAPTQESLPGTSPANQSTNARITTSNTENCVPFYSAETRGNFSSTGYGSGRYPGNQHCLYTFIQRNGFCSILLSFRDFDIFPSANCLEDYLELSGNRHCQQQLMQSIREIAFPWSQSSTLTVIFHSERPRLNRGFLADFEQIPCANARQSRQYDNVDLQLGSTNTTLSANDLARSPAIMEGIWQESGNETTLPDSLEA